MNIIKFKRLKRSKKKPAKRESLPLRELHKHPFMVPVVTIFIMLVGSFMLWLYAGGVTVEDSDVKRVNLTVDGQQKTVPTRAKTVGQLLERLEIKLAKEDVIEPGLNSPILNEDFSVNVYHAKPVTIVDKSGKKVIAKIAESTPAGIAKKAGFKVYPEDYVNFAPPDQAISNGVVGDLVLIDPATPAHINLYGKSISVRTHAKTVGDLLNDKGIHEIEGDNVLPSKDTPITEDISIFVVPAGKKVEIREEIIPAPEETTYDATLDASVQKVIEAGRDGKRVVIYEIEEKNGKEVGKKEIQSLVSVDPVKRVVVRGTKVAGFEGGFASALAALRSCEGGYSSVNPAGYYGAYQFNSGTWAANAPAGYRDTRPDQAPPAIQDQAASNLYRSRGWQPWPSCSVRLGLQDVYR